MIEKKKRPRSFVSKERAMEHGLLTIRRSWAGGVPDFEDWGGAEIDPEPLLIHDINGQVLFYEFGVMDGKKMVGYFRASASKIIGSAVPIVGLGPRTWDPGKAGTAAKEKVKKRFPKTKIIKTELVCYSYPRMGVRVYFEDPKLGKKSLIVDVGDFSFVENFGADELEGSTAWSFYREVAEKNAVNNEQLWEQTDKDLEAAKSATPKIVDSALTARELPKLKHTFIPELEFPISFISWRTIKFSFRCNTHDCFELYAQKNNWYCAVATGQMILDFYRYYYSQDDIADAMGTIDYVGTYNSGQVQGYESLSKNCLDATYDNTANWSEAKAEIDANRPLKSGVPGHARACAGWKRENICLWPGPCKRWLKIYDPSPPNPDICSGGSIYWEDWDTKTHTNFIYVRHRTTPCS